MSEANKPISEVMCGEKVYKINPPVPVIESDVEDEDGSTYLTADFPDNMSLYAFGLTRELLLDDLYSWINYLWSHYQNETSPVSEDWLTARAMFFERIALEITDGRK